MAKATLLVAGVLFSGMAMAEGIENPYGVCAHLTHMWPITNVEPKLEIIHKAGIGWVRCDFDWSRINPSPGKWNFIREDNAIAAAEKNQINILPILLSPPKNLIPGYKHLDEFEAFVSGTVSRYQKQIRAWEIWNEPNHHGPWGESPSGENYALLLKRAHEAIKRIDPKLKVVYGGTAGVAHTYIEQSLKAGAGQHFDVMNVHSYFWQGIPEMMITEILKLKSIMKANGVGDKPIWITEMGWSTATQSPTYIAAIKAAFKRAGINIDKVNVAVVEDANMGFSSGPGFGGAEYFNFLFKNTSPVKLSDLHGLSVTKYPVLVPCSGEYFPGKYIQPLVDYVRRGGTILLPSGIPFYYDLQLDGTKWLQMVQVNDKFHSAFHIGWESWWTGKGIPRRPDKVTVAPGFEDEVPEGFPREGYFLHGRNLKPGDEFIPIITAESGAYKEALVALYKLNSDLKGNVIVYAGNSQMQGTTEEMQAALLARTYLVALGIGIERLFWYKFRLGERDPYNREHHFGIVHKDSSPKPAFHAYKILTELCPAGSTRPRINMRGKTFIANWTRPDKTNVWAIWTVAGTKAYHFSISGNNVTAFNHLGEKQQVPDGDADVSPKVLYIVGAENVVVK